MTAGQDTTLTPPALDPGLHLTLPDISGSVETCRLAVRNYLAPSQPSEQALFRMELVLEECLMNIIWHAFDEAGENDMDVHARVSGGELTLRFEDGGRAFDPTLAEDPKLPTSLKDAKPGGLGLMLVRKFASSVAYSRIGDRNQLTVVLPLR